MTYNTTKNNKNKNFIDKKEEEFTREMVVVTGRAIKKYGLNLNKDGHAVDCEADAFRHAYMQSYLSYKYGSLAANVLGLYHEHGVNPDDDPSTNMDLWNNQIGREIAEEIKKEKGNNVDEDLFEYLASEKIVQKMEKGELITEPYEDKRRYINMEKERLRDEDRVFYEDEFWDELDDNERIRFKEHYTNYKNQHQKGLPSKKELDANVAKGYLIYVNDYTRSDGKKVRGYYRRRPVY